MDEQVSNNLTISAFTIAVMAGSGVLVQTVLFLLVGLVFVVFKALNKNRPRGPIENAIKGVKDEMAMQAKDEITAVEKDILEKINKS